MTDQVNDLIEQASEYSKLGEHERALEAYHKCIKIADKVKGAEILNYIARVYNEKEDYKNELTYLKKSNKIFNKLGRTVEYIRGLVAEQYVYAKLNNNIMANIGLRRCLKLSEEIGNTKVRSEIVRDIAYGFYNLEKYQKAVDVFNKINEIGNSIELDCLIGKGKCYHELKNYQEAEELFKLALKNSISLELYSVELEALEMLAQHYFSTYQHHEFLVTSRSVLLKEISETLKAKTLNSIGIKLILLNELDEANVIFQEALIIVKGLRDMGLEAEINKGIAVILSAKGDHQSAMSLLQGSLEVAHELNLLLLESVVLRLIGTIYHKLLVLSKAVDYLEASLRLAKKLKDYEQQKLNLLGLALVYMDYEIDYEVREKFGKAFKLAEVGNDNLFLKQLKESYGIYKINKNELEEAKELFNDAYSLAKTLDIPGGKSSSLYWLGVLAGKEGDYVESKKYIEQAIDLSNSEGIKITNQNYYRSLGNCYQQLGKHDHAAIQYKKSIEITANKRKNILIESEKRELDHFGQIYYADMIDALVKSNQSINTFEYIQDSKAHTFMDQIGDDTNNQLHVIKERDLNFISDSKALLLITKVMGKIFFPGVVPKYGPDSRTEFKSTISMKPLNIEQIQAHLNPEQTLIEYYIGYRVLVIWILTTGSVNCVSFESDTDELYWQVKGLRDNTRYLKENTKIFSNRLYHILFKPVEHLIKTKELIFVPHGILHYFPMQTCIDDDGNYLLETYNIKYLPSSSVFPFLKAHTQGEVKLMGLCNPSTNVSGFNSLPHVKGEISKVSVHNPEMKIFDNGISVSKFSEIARNYNYLHLACHSSQIDMKPMQTSLIIGNDSDEGSKLKLSEIMQMRLNANLAVLSSCETGIGDMTEGDEVICLSRAFLQAGAASVVFSLWQVNDESTAFLMGEFYKYMKDHSTSEALRLAQLATKEKYDHIYHWAPFIYTGLN